MLFRSVSRWKFGCANDVSVLGIVLTPREATTTAQREVDAVLAWASENAVSLDPAKARVVYFLGPKTRRCGLPPIKVGALEVRASDEIQ